MTTRDGSAPLVTRQTIAGIGALLVVVLVGGVFLMLAAAAASLEWWDLIPLALFGMGAAVAIFAVGTLVEIVR